MSDFEKRIVGLYKPPFRFDERGGYIWDADNNMVADNHVDGDQVLRVRGWGRISYMEDAEKLQDGMGEIIARALTEFWERQAATGDTVQIPEELAERVGK